MTNGANVLRGVVHSNLLEVPGGLTVSQFVGVVRALHHRRSGSKAGG